MNPTLLAKLKSINPTEGEWNFIATDVDKDLITLAPAMRQELLKREEEVNYWKARCKLAETCIEESPCDPDITKGQIIAFENYHNFIKNNTNPTQP